MGGLNDRPPNAAGTILGRKKTPEDIELEKERAEREEALTRDVQERRAHLEEIRALMFKWSEWALDSKYVSQEEKAELQENRERLDETLQLLDKLLSVSPLARQADILYVAKEFLWCGLTLGRFTPPEKAFLHHYEKQVRTVKMREARANKPEEKALKQAVLDAIDGKPLDHPDALAGSILKIVNKALARQGYKPVSKGTVYRRIVAHEKLEHHALEERGKSEPRS